MTPGRGCVRDVVGGRGVDLAALAPAAAVAAAVVVDFLADLDADCMSRKKKDGVDSRLCVG